MSQPVMALPAAGLGDANENYQNMVAANGVGAFFEAEAAQAMTTLRGPGTTPRMPADVSFALRNMREGLFPILRDVMGGLANTDAQDALKLAEAGVRARLVVQARTAVEARNRATPGMGWTRYLGTTGVKMRNMVGVFNEAGVGRVMWGEGTYENRRIQQEVNTQIAARFAGRTFDTLDPGDQDIVRQEVGRLAPNTMAFNMQGLLEWARANDSTVPNPAAPGTVLNYYDLVSGILGEQEVASRYAVPIFGLIQKNPAYRAHLEAIYNNRVNTPGVQTAYNTERERRTTEENRMKSFEGRIQKIKSALEELSKIRKQETLRNRNQALARPLDALLNPPGLAPGAPRPPTGLSQQVEKEKEASLKAYNQAALAATAELGELINRFKGNYRRELLTITGLTPATYGTLLQIDATGALAPSPPAAPFDPEELISRFNNTLDVDAGTLGMDPAQATAMEPPVVLPMGLNDQHEQLKNRVERRDEPYGPTNRPALATAGYKDFADLQEKSKKSVESRAGGNNLTPHQLLYELNYRQLAVQIPPPVPGAPPAAVNARNLAIEDAMIRATISTLMLIDRVDSSMDEGFAVRHAQNITRTRLTRWAERKARLTFGQFVKNNLTRQERFKGLKDLKLDTNANTILQWVNEEKLKEEDLRPLMSEIELAGQDQLGGRGKLEFNLDVRPLLFQIQLAHYRRRAEALVAKASEPGVGKKAEVMLELIKTEAPKLIPTPPAPGSKPSDLETNTESYIRQRRETLEEEAKGLPVGSPERTAKERALRFLDNPLVRELGSELFAEAAVRGVVEASKLFSRRAATNVAEEVGEEAADALTAVRKRTNRKATRAITGAAAKLAA